MNNKVVVTLADSNYFEMLIELVDSITRFKESSNVDICVLDAQELFYQNTFQIIKNIYGLIVMHGFKIGIVWNYILKLVIVEDLALHKQ